MNPLSLEFSIDRVRLWLTMTHWSQGPRVGPTERGIATLQVALGLISYVTFRLLNRTQAIQFAVRDSVSGELHYCISINLPSFTCEEMEPRTWDNFSKAWSKTDRNDTKHSGSVRELRGPTPVLAHTPVICKDVDLGWKSLRNIYGTLVRDYANEVHCSKTSVLHK